jgi:hypothetical protein
MSVNKRKCLSVSEKDEIIHELKCGEKKYVYKKLNLSSSTVSSLYKNKEKNLSAFEKNLTTNKKMRKCGFDDIDKALLEWFKVQRDAGFPINGPILKIHAEKFAMQLEHKDYSCSNGQLNCFKIGIISSMFVNMFFLRSHVYQIMVIPSKSNWSCCTCYNQVLLYY